MANKTNSYTYRVVSFKGGEINCILNTVTMELGKVGEIDVLNVTCAATPENLAQLLDYGMSVTRELNRYCTTFLCESLVSALR